VWCSVGQCVAVCCSVVQSVAVCCSVVQCGYISENSRDSSVLLRANIVVCFSVLQSNIVAVCCSVLQRGAVWCSVVR